LQRKGERPVAISPTTRSHTSTRFSKLALL